MGESAASVLVHVDGADAAELRLRPSTGADADARQAGASSSLDVPARVADEDGRLALGAGDAQRDHGQVGSRLLLPTSSPATAVDGGLVGILPSSTRRSSGPPDVATAMVISRRCSSAMELDGPGEDGHLVQHLAVVPGMGLVELRQVAPDERRHHLVRAHADEAVDGGHLHAIPWSRHACHHAMVWR